jgi:DNA-binding LacI/PurR family transcriptional regulator
MNIYDIAKEAGVSISTVSLAVNYLTERRHRAGNTVYVKDLNTESAKMKCRGFLGAPAEREVENGKRRVFPASYGIDGGRRKKFCGAARI